MPRAWYQTTNSGPFGQLKLWKVCPPTTFQGPSDSQKITSPRPPLCGSQGEVERRSLGAQGDQQSQGFAPGGAASKGWWAPPLFGLDSPPMSWGAPMFSRVPDQKFRISRIFPAPQSLVLFVPSKNGNTPLFSLGFQLASLGSPKLILSPQSQPKSTGR